MKYRDAKLYTLNHSMTHRCRKRHYQQLKRGLLAGFCIGGYYPSDSVPHAFEIIFDPLVGTPTPTPIQMGQARCWGVPKIFGRLVSGIDTDLKAEILQSGKWAGSEGELNSIIARHQLYIKSLPIRDAIDFVHACIFSTSKAIKSSSLSQTCGGPIEIAVITTDRPYRWVRHKEWHAAITEGMQL
jgi:hypothetical protein